MKVWHGLVIAVVSFILQACLFTAINYLLCRNMGKWPGISLLPLADTILQPIARRSPEDPFEYLLEDPLGRSSCTG